MFGLVLWSDEEERRAVFWCEDHGDLAFYDAAQDGPDGPLSLQRGDMVRFRVTIEQDYRSAHNVEVVTKEVCHWLGDSLLRSASRSQAAGETGEAKVLDLREGAEKLGRKTG